MPRATQTVKTANQLLTFQYVNEIEIVRQCKLNVHDQKENDAAFSGFQLTVIKHAVAAVDFRIELSNHTDK